MTKILTHQQEGILVRLAESPEEITAVQRLRYSVFYEEYDAQPSDIMAREKRDFDSYDDIVDHLVVVDSSLGEGPQSIVGTYRLLRHEIAKRHSGFYTSDEYDIQPLLDSGNTLLELGRSCVRAEYRTRPVLQKLWEGIAHYVADHDIGLMFGCASFPGTDVDAISKQLAYLYHYHLAPDNLRPKALDKVYVDMNLHPKDDIDARRTFASMPPLVKGYVRLGASIGDGAFIDRQWDSIDVCIVMPTGQVTEKYLRHYKRVTQKTFSGADSDTNDTPLSETGLLNGTS